jgi:peptidoglycan hydrolase CwlO-like protein
VLQHDFALKAQELESQLGDKEMLLQSRAAELEGLQSKIDALMGQVSQLETVIEDAQAAAAMHARHAEEITQRYETERDILKASLSEKEETLLGKDSTIAVLQHDFALKAQELESQLGDKEMLLQSRAAELEGSNQRSMP